MSSASDVNPVELRRMRAGAAVAILRAAVQWKWIWRPLPSSSHLASAARCSGAASDCFTGSQM
jgi:hypothetical protein